MFLRLFTKDNLIKSQKIVLTVTVRAQIKRKFFRVILRDVNTGTMKLIAAFIAIDHKRTSIITATDTKFI